MIGWLINRIRGRVELVLRMPKSVEEAMVSMYKGPPASSSTKLTSVIREALHVHWIIHHLLKQGKTIHVNHGGGNFQPLYVGEADSDTDPPRPPTSRGPFTVIEGGRR